MNTLVLRSGPDFVIARALLLEASRFPRPSTSSTSAYFLAQSCRLYTENAALGATTVLNSVAPAMRGGTPLPLPWNALPDH